MGGSRPGGLVLDAGALIAFEQGNRQMRALVQRAKDRGVDMVVPAGVVAQTWRSGARQARLAALLSAREVQVEELTAQRARAVGELCGLRKTSDIVDASVVLAARGRGATVITSDPDDIRRLDPKLNVVSV